jgi:hypothetical protein
VAWSIKRRLDYIDWAKEVVAELRGTSPSLEAQFDRAAEDAERSIAVAAFARLNFHNERTSCKPNILLAEDRLSSSACLSSEKRPADVIGNAARVMRMPRVSSQRSLLLVDGLPNMPVANRAARVHVRSDADL